METIHVKFDELTAMASECNNSGPGFNCSNFQNSLEDSQSLPSKEDLNNLFGPMYEEYYATRTLPNTRKQEKEKRTCGDYLKYEESLVRIKCGSILKKKKSNYLSFQDLRSSCNEDMVKYEGPRPSTT
ncbi:hypothetical protein Tco_1110474 [Tanacetum coccineum]|uniref:Uncharacterized protein n=1 Tax=Tanacetum coccineum TaxID=301880 RepID=A0ABQ5IJC5_9ASTR